MPQTALERLRALRTEVGTSAFDRAFRQLNKERLSNREREPRKHFPPKMYQTLYDRQQGRCPYCGDPLLIPARRNVIDHFDPNAQDFNNTANLRLSHRACNAEKAAMTPTEFAKLFGKPVAQMIPQEEIPE